MIPTVTEGFLIFSSNRKYNRLKEKREKEKKNRKKERKYQRKKERQKKREKREKRKIFPDFDFSNTKTPSMYKLSFCAPHNINS
ncbi:MAG: hypothetical protein ACOYM7_08005 [Paludibacter sp.]